MHEPEIVNIIVTLRNFARYIFAHIQVIVLYLWLW